MIEVYEMSIYFSDLPYLDIQDKDFIEYGSKYTLDEFMYALNNEMLDTINNWYRIINKNPKD